MTDGSGEFKVIQEYVLKKLNDLGFRKELYEKTGKK